MITAGTHDVRVSLQPPTNRRQSGLAPINRSVPATFGPTGARVDLHVYGVRYSYSNVPPVIQQQAGISGPNWSARAQTDFEPRCGSPPRTPCCWITGGTFE